MRGGPLHLQLSEEHEALRKVVRDFGIKLPDWRQSVDEVVKRLAAR